MDLCVVEEWIVELSLARRRHRLTGLIKQSWIESGCVYGYRKIGIDDRKPGIPPIQPRVDDGVRLIE